MEQPPETPEDRKEHEQWLERVHDETQQEYEDWLKKVNERMVNKGTISR